MSTGDVAKKKKKGVPSGYAGKNRPKIVAADLFCGAGGLTNGLAKAGIEVRVGVDIDPACEYPYTANNDSTFRRSWSPSCPQRISTSEMTEALSCRPAAPPSAAPELSPEGDHQRSPLEPAQSFWPFGGGRDFQPDPTTMENVPNLAKQKVFRRFVKSAEESRDFNVSHEVIDCSEFGVPQTRRRLVPPGVKLGPISLMRKRKRKSKTVKQAIFKMPSLTGQVYERDPLHQTSELSDLNLKRIQASTPEERGETGTMSWSPPAISARLARLTPVCTVACLGANRRRPLRPNTSDLETAGSVIPHRIGPFRSAKAPYFRVSRRPIGS